jgi:hypothetical protein
VDCITDAEIITIQCLSTNYLTKPHQLLTCEMKTNDFINQDDWAGPVTLSQFSLVNVQMEILYCK